MEASRGETQDQATSEQLARAAARLQQGGLVAFPTETVYGLGADARNDDAVARIFAAKGRPRFDPLIVHFAQAAEALAYGAAGDGLREELAEAFWPGPLTLLVPKHESLSYLTTNGAETVAVRVPRHPLAQKLLARAGVPVAAPSANRFGHVSPTTADHVRSDLGDVVDVILDGGRCTLGVESTVVGIDQGEMIVHRLGGVTLEQLAAFGPVRMADPEAERFSPGRLKSHYAPDAALRMFPFGEAVPECPRDEDSRGKESRDETSECKGSSDEGLVLFQPRAGIDALVLSKKGSVEDAAANLFGLLREAEKRWKRVCIEGAPDVGLGRAINDRLRRASVPRTDEGS